MKPPEPTRPEGCSSDLRMDRFLAGELTEAEQTAFSRHVASCGRCAGRLASISAERARLDERAPAFLTAAAAQPLANASLSGAAPPSVWRKAAPALTILAAAAAVVLWVARPDRALPPVVSGETTQAKGGSRIGFYVARGEELELGSSGDPVFPADRLQFYYSTDSAGYLALVSVDGARVVSVYFPSGPKAELVRAGREVALPRSWILDQTLGDELVWGLFCDKAIELESVRTALEASPTSAPRVPGCHVDGLRLVKRAGR